MQQRSQTMTFHSDEGISEWVASLEKRLGDFVRGDLFLITKTPEREWWAQVIENVSVTAPLITNLVLRAERSPEGCLEASVARSKRISVGGRQVYAYQLIYWAGNALIPNSQDVVRHKCHNRRCINPQHLTHGTQMENINDTRDR